MKAIMIQQDERHSLLWTEVEEPALRSNEVRIKVAYAALNRADLMQREGDYPPPPDCPEWMGLEVSGEIVDSAKKPQSILPFMWAIRCAPFWAAEAMPSM